MDTLYGFYLLITLGCIYYVLERYISKQWIDSKDNLSFSQQRRRQIFIRIVAFFVIFSAWYFQNEYRHKYSREAQAMKMFDKLLNDWEDGKKKEVIQKLEHMSLEERSWDVEEPDDIYQVEDYGSF